MVFVVFFQNIQQPTNRLVFECGDSVLYPLFVSLLFLKVTTFEQLLEYWKNLQKFF